MNACFALMVGTSTGALAWVPSFLNRSHGLEVSQVGLALGLIIGIGGIFGTVVIGGFLSDRLVKRDLRWGLWIGAVGAALMAVGYILMISASSGNGALIAFLIPGILGIFFQGPLMALIQAVSPVKMRATSVAISLFITNLLGLGLGPLIIGTLSDLLSPTYGDASLQMALLAIPVTLVISIFAFIAAARPLIEDIKRAEAY
jgi:MFS family permease